MAEHIQAVQEQGDLQHYNQRFDSGRLVAASMERLQHRREEDLPPLPAGLVRGSPESVLSPVVLSDTTGPTPYEEAKSQEDAWE